MIEIEQKGNKEYRFQLKNADGTVLLSSVPFADEEKIKRTISELGPLVHKSAVFERKTDYSGKFLFVLKDRTGQLLGQSPLYDSEAGMENGIKHVRNRVSVLGTDKET